MVCSLCGLQGHNKRTCKNKDPNNIGNILNDMINKVITMNKDLDEVENSLNMIITKVEKENKPVKNNKKAIDNENTIMNKINEDDSYNELIKQKLSDNEINMSSINALKPTKDNGYKLQCSEQWIKYKNGTKEKSPSSKSDLLLSDLKLNIGVSIKSGKGRWTSADCCETSAILLSVWENKYNHDSEIKDIIDKIIEYMKNVGKHKPLYKYRNKTIICKEIKSDSSIHDADTEWVKLLEQKCNECNSLWCILVESHLDYVKDIIFECASGEYKFGRNYGRAHILIVTDKNTPNIKKVCSLKNRTPELDEYLISQLPSSSSIFACKSGGTGKEMWMRFL